MATMATSHGFSVLANNSIKAPINPKTGLSKTMPERFASSLAHYDIDGEMEEEEQRRIKGGRSALLVDEASPAFEVDDIARELSNLSDDEFYLKLTQLRMEHRKTLATCQRLYQEKLNSERSHDGFSDIFGQGPTTLAVNGHVSSQEAAEQDGWIIGRQINGYADKDTPVKDLLRDMSSKPPSGRFTMPCSAQRSSPLRTKYRPNSAPIHRHQLSHSLDEDMWHRATDSDDGEIEIYNETAKSETYEPGDVSAALSQIDDMWENFSVEEYAPRRSRPSSASVTRREKEKKEKEWRHRLTIPQPFQMTIREASKERKRSTACMQLERERLEKEKVEEAECQKKFKASPAPAHIYLPLYDEIMEKNESRRRYIQQYSKELMQSQEKPFNFLKRDEDRKRHKRIYSAPLSERPGKKNFQAKPVPKYIFDNGIDDKILEEEEYRKIRMKMRAEEMLRSSSLPPNMEARQRAKEQKLREKVMRSRRKSHNKPKINPDVPDYDALYRQFQRELARRKHEKESTVVQPFNLHTQGISSNKDKIIRDIEKDEQTLRENRWPFKSARMTPRRDLGSLSTSLDSIPAKSTNAADLRSSLNRDKLYSLTRAEQQELEEERRRRIKGMRLRKSIQERTSEPGSARVPVATRLKKEAERARMEQYEQELAEMKQRVDKRPLLFERESQTNARKSVEKKFSSTLRSVGLDEDFIHSRSSRASSTRDVGDDYSYDDDFDETYVKTTGNDMDDRASPRGVYAD